MPCSINRQSSRCRLPARIGRALFEQRCGRGGGHVGPIADCPAMLLRCELRSQVAQRLLAADEQPALRSERRAQAVKQITSCFWREIDRHVAAEDDVEFSAGRIWIKQVAPLE